MKDRQPYPGKEGLMKHTPCDASGVPTGAPAYYAKVDMADSPLAIGTPFNKANLLSDETAAKLNGATTPNAAFDLLSRFHAGMGNEYVWQRSDGAYVNSTVSNAYPPTPSDGYTYTALGQIGSKVQIATGSYTGTGTYGASNPNSLTLPFAPIIFEMVAYARDGQASPLQNEDLKCYTRLYVPFVTTEYTAYPLGYHPGYVSHQFTKKSSDSKTIYWYVAANAADPAFNQFNWAGTTYAYFAIG